MLKQSSLGETAHWAVSFAAELRVEQEEKTPAPNLPNYKLG